MIRKLCLVAALCGAVAAVPGNAAIIASSDFSTGTQGWTAGEFTALGGTGPVDYDVTGQRITTGDTFANVGFIAPTAYLGNQSAAFGGSISFDLSDAFNDGIDYSPLALISGTTTLYATRTPPPSTTTLTTFSITLTGANFFTGNPFGAGQTPITDAQLLAVLGSLDRVAILADWAGGGDFSSLDNVVLSDGVTAVPEPASWALMIGGFGIAGGAMRRQRRITATA